MKRIIKITLLVTLINSLLSGIFALIREKSFGAFLYYLVLTYPNIVLIVFLGVLLFFFVKRKFKYSNVYWEGIIQILLLSLFVQLGFVLWAYVETVSWYEVSTKITFQMVREDYLKEFGSTWIITLIGSVEILIIDKFKLKAKNVA